jgi:histidine phosphotransferase ChpT
MNDRLRLAELLAGRLCHDLSGPLGTLMGSLELMSEEPETAEEALSLASEVSVTLGRRLRLLRAAWGGAVAPLAVEELRSLAAGLPQAHRISLQLDRLVPSARFPPVAARLVLNLMLLAAESLPAGGAIALAGDPEGEVQVSILGLRAAWPAGLAAYLADEERAWAALGGESAETLRGLQAPLTALVARTGGLRLAMLMARETEAAPPLVFAPA